MKKPSLAQLYLFIMGIYMGLTIYTALHTLYIHIPHFPNVKVKSVYEIIN